MKALLLAAAIAVPPNLPSPPVVPESSAFLLRSGGGSAEDVSVTVVDNNAVLLTLVGPIPKTVYRAGFYAPSDGGGQWYSWQVTNCSSPDNGAQVQPSGAFGCWIANRQGSNDVRIWGADPTGVADSTSAFANCLSAVGASNTCYAGGGIYKLLSTVMIPASTTLDCGYTFPDRADYNSGYSTAPAIKATMIAAGGDGAAVKNCLIYRNGMTFPPANSSGFTGVGLSDSGHASFSVINTEIFGFDTCVWFVGIRPYMQRDLVDCNGVSHAAIEIDTGNTDSGYIKDVRINPLNGAGTCASLSRDGTGIRLGGSGGPGAYLDGMVVQGFKVAQYEFGGGGVTEIGQIWADNPYSLCGRPANAYGVIVGPGASIQGHQVYISAQHLGMMVQSDGAESNIHFLTLSNVDQGIQLGDASHSGNLNTLTTVIDGVVAGAIYIGHSNASYHSHRTVMAHVNGSAPPYIQSDALVTTAIGLGPTGQFSVVSLQTDLGSACPFQSGRFTTVDGSTETLTGLSACP